MTGNLSIAQRTVNRTYLPCMQVGAAENSRWRAPNVQICTRGNLAPERKCCRVTPCLSHTGEMGRQRDKTPGLLLLRDTRTYVRRRAAFVVTVAYMLCRLAASMRDHSFATQHPAFETGECTTRGTDHPPRDALRHRVLPTCTHLVQGSKREKSLGDGRTVCKVSSPLGSREIFHPVPNVVGVVWEFCAFEFKSVHENFWRGISLMS